MKALVETLRMFVILTIFIMGMFGLASLVIGGKTEHNSGIDY